MKVGAITVGQSPRVDITPDILPLLPGIELIEMGALDGLTKGEIEERYAPTEGDEVLVSRLNDGQSATFSERLILPRLQACIDALEAQGVSLIAFFCTGDFPVRFAAKVPLLYPKDILLATVPLLAPQGHIIVVTPSPAQLEQSRASWQNHVAGVEVLAASPYDGWEELEAGAETAKGLSGELIVLDCIGFSAQMKALFAEATGLPVILPRTLLARVIAEYAT